MKERIMAMIDEFVKFLNALINKYLGEIEL